MARMIPPAIDQDTRSSAERKLFSLFRDMPDTGDWYVLHSVSIAKHPTQSQGEADFIIAIPDAGIFALEVKGGRIQYENGVWYSVDRFDRRNMIKNPVSEANEAMHALMSFIKDNNSADLHWCLFGYGVIFPDSSVHGSFSVPDLDDSQIADIDNMSDLKGYLLKLARFWKSRKNQKVFVPHKQQIDEIVSLLRPNYDFRVSVSSQIRNVEKQIIVLTENQKNVFDGLMGNDRCLIRGSAGTGKTVLAMESARIFAAEGKKVGLFCYNRNLAGWLKENIGDNESIVCDGLLDYMEKAVRPRMGSEYEKIKEENLNLFYSRTVPSLYADFLLEGFCEPFDVLIIDEAQDVFDEVLLETVDLMVAGGLKEGKWLFFMDADRQNLYFARLNYDEISRLLGKYTGAFTNFSLFSNCRNSQAIIEKLDSIYGTHTKYRKMDIRGADVVIRSYRKKQDQPEIVEFILRGLIREKMQPDDIVILSALKFDHSAASELSMPISQDRTDRKGRFLFSTVHSFKGLESPVVILTDFERLDHEERMNLLYVGMTRARSALYIVMADRARQKLDEIIREVARNG